MLNKPKPAASSYNTVSFQNLILRAISGDTSANQKLSNLVDLNIPFNNDYNKLITDSLITKGKKKFFIVLLNYPNPIYNRLAVYDTALNMYLIDKSLNGYVSESLLNLNEKRLIKISESFISKDVLQVNRTSLYEINDSSANLCFRTFTRLTLPGSVFTQSISAFSNDQIITELSGTKVSTISGMKDIFTFNRSNKEYSSTGKVFDNFVLDRIKNFVNYSDKPEIIDKKTLYASVGIDIDVDTIKNTGNIKSTEGYTLTLTDNWKTFKGITVTDFLKSPLKGSKCINDVIGANISVIALPESDSTENYVDYKLTNSTVGKYRVRYSEKIISKNNFVQFFEYSWGTKKYLLILIASRYTYDQYKNDFNNIINSFSINS
jgi:hypothetical protein